MKITTTSKKRLNSVNNHENLIPLPSVTSSQDVLFILLAELNVQHDNICMQTFYFVSVSLFIIIYPLKACERFFIRENLQSCPQNIRFHRCDYFQ